MRKRALRVIGSQVMGSVMGSEILLLFRISEGQNVKGSEILLRKVKGSEILLRFKISDPMKADPMKEISRSPTP
jgi:hypothetical protein